MCANRDAAALQTIVSSFLWLRTESCAPCKGGGNCPPDLPLQKKEGAYPALAGDAVERAGRTCLKLLAA
eukprot:6647909-Alexandrium_andersonii.AAC.1